MHPFNLALDAHASTLDAMTEAMRKAAMSPEVAERMEQLEVGHTPASVVYEENKLELLHYESRTDEQCDVPICIVYALINRPYILDLQPDRSVVRRLLEAGHDVYLIDWNEPSRLDAHLDLSDYADRYLDNCVDVVRDRSGRERINLLGYCMGGTFASIYTALYPGKVNALGLMAPALHFDGTGGILEEWGSEEFFDPQTVTNTYGVVPAELLEMGFGMLDPVQQYLQKYVTLWENLDDEEFVANFARMERWLDDGVDMAGGVFEEFVTKLYQENRLTRNELEVGGKQVDLENVEAPILQVLGEYDHLIPAEASKPFADVVPSEDVTTIEYPVGHIGLSVSSSAHTDVWPQVCEWYHDVSAGDE